MIYGFVAALSGMGLISCKKLVYTPGELVSHVQDTTGEFVQSKNVGNVHVQVNYLPAAYSAVTEMRSPTFSAHAYKLLENEYEPSHVFRVRLWCHNKVHPLKIERIGREEWYMRKKYFDYDVLKDVKLLQGKDTLDCALHHHFYNDMSPDMELMFVFEKKKTSAREPLTFVYNDRLFGAGYLLFTFDKEVINFRPQIKI